MEKNARCASVENLADQPGFVTVCCMAQYWDDSAGRQCGQKILKGCAYPAGKVLSFERDESEYVIEESDPLMQTLDAVMR
jgi:hypothetical protein